MKKLMVLFMMLFTGNILSVNCSTYNCDSEYDYYIPLVDSLSNVASFKEAKVGEVIFQEIVERKSLFLNIPEGTTFKQANYEKLCKVEVQEIQSIFKRSPIEGASDQSKVHMCAKLKVKNIDERESCKAVTEPNSFLGDRSINRICIANDYRKFKNLNKDNPFLIKLVGNGEFSGRKFIAKEYNLSFSKESRKLISNTYFISYLSKNRVEITQKDEVNNKTSKVNIDISGDDIGVLKISTYDEKSFGKDLSGRVKIENVYGRKFTFFKKDGGYFYKAFPYLASEAILDKQQEEEKRYYAKLTQRCVDSGYTDEYSIKICVDVEKYNDKLVQRCIGFGYKDENSIKGCVQQEKFNEKKLEKQRQEFKAEQYKIAQLQQELKEAKSESFWDGVWQQAFSNYTQQKLNVAFQKKINNLNNQLRREQRFNRKQRKKPNEYKQLEPIKYSN